MSESAAKSETVDPEQVQEEFSEAQDRWGRALEAHRMATPNAQFSERLAELAAAARTEAEVCRKADAAGFEWPPHRKAGSKPPYELQPGTGRRGPDDLWRSFDGSVEALNRAASGTDLIEVARAYDDIARVAQALADAVECEDRASGLLPRRRARKTA
jgi:hypothetical protein